MIIDINQTEANSNQLFDVFYDNKPKYNGKLGRFSALETFSLRNRASKANLTGAFALPSPLDMVPLIYLLGRPKVIHNCYCQNGMRRLGVIGCIEEGIRKAHHRITDAENREFHAYHFTKNGYEYIAIYLGETEQVAMIESSLTLKDSCHRYKMYLLDSYSECADIFSMFVMYFANWYATSRFRAKAGTKTVQKKQTRNYKDKFDPEWRAVNFPETVPDENTAR